MLTERPTACGTGSPKLYCNIILIKTVRGRQVATNFGLQVEVEQLNFRLSYNDIKLFLAIAQSLPSLESKEPRLDPLKRHEREIKG